MPVRQRQALRLWLLASTGVVVLVLAAGALAIWWLLADFDDVRQGTLAWHVALPGYLKAAPVPQACDEPRYSFHGIDGPRPQVAAVRFRTRLSSDDVHAAYAALLAGCAPDGSQPQTRWRCAGRDYGEIEIEVGTAPQGDCRPVHIRFIAR